MTSKIPRWPFVLLGAMTILTFGGPLLIGYVLKGGPSPKWPPDRAIEWVTFFGISGTVVLMMLASLALALLNYRDASRKMRAKSEKPGAEP